MKNKIALGLMSGTSADGLTVCAAQVSPFRVLHVKTYPYAPALQRRLLHAYAAGAAELSALNMELGQLYAAKTKLFLKEFRIPLAQLVCAGSHGQTVYHGPNDKFPNTLQLGEPAFLANLLGRPVVSDFRPRDISLGGQGAPLVPFFDEYIWGKGPAKILLNVGGVANFSVVGKNVRPMGCDCGPGNTLMDLACQQTLGLPYDKSGARAAKGAPDEALVNRWLQNPFFAQKPPKSLDKNQFGEAFLKQHFPHLTQAHLNDALATLNLFTAAAVAQAVTRFVPKTAQKELVVSGGGALNQTLLNNLQTLCPQLRVTTSDSYGIDPLAKESAAFALMAYNALQGKTNHCPAATGARKKTILGKVTL